MIEQSQVRSGGGVCAGVRAESANGGPDPNQTDYSLMVVDLSVGMIVEAMDLEGQVHAVDVVDELGTVYAMILSHDDSERTVVGLDLQTRQVVFETQLPVGVFGFHVDAEHGRLYAADQDAAELIEIDVSSSSSWHHPSGGAFHTVQHVRNSRFLMVSGSGSDDARIWDMDERSFLDVEFGRYRTPLLSDDGETLYGSHIIIGMVVKVDLHTGIGLSYANTDVFWPRVELPESGSRLKFVSGTAAGEVDFDTHQSTIEFSLSGPLVPSVLTTHGDFIVMAEPRQTTLCPPLLPCDFETPPASIFVFDRDNGNLIREVEMPPGGVFYTSGRFLSETARGAPEPMGVPVIGLWGLVAMILVIIASAGLRWSTGRGVNPDA